MSFGHLIHVYGNKSLKDTTLCCAPVSEAQAQESFYAIDAALFEQSDKNYGWFARYSRDGSRHHECLERFSLAILHTCRQIYHEVKDVLYFSNTFSFRNSSALPTFMGSLLKSSANPYLAIRSLHLNIQICGEEDLDEWNKAIQNVPIHLPNVQRLYINLDLDIADPEEFAICYSPTVPLKYCLLGALYQLRILPLKEIVVIVADEDWAATQRGEEWFSSLEDEYRWTIGQKQEYATEIREVLFRSRELKMNRVCRK